MRNLIETPRLKLIPAELRHLEVIYEPDKFAAEIGCTVCDGWNQFPGAMKQAYESLLIAPELLGWWTYFFIQREDNALIGTGGFHGRPDPKGGVEIGYCIANSYQHKNYAIEAARGLISYALADKSVAVVNAHTLPEESASTAVLKKVGMSFAGIKIDPIEGTLWHWQILR